MCVEDKNSLPLVNDDSASGANTLQRPSLPLAQDMDSHPCDVSLTAAVASNKSTAMTAGTECAIRGVQSNSLTTDTVHRQQTLSASSDETPIWNSVEAVTPEKRSNSSVVEEQKLSTSDEVDPQEDYIALDQCQSGSGHQRRNELSIQVCVTSALGHKFF